MKINRRDFLKLFGMAAVGTQLPDLPQIETALEATVSDSVGLLEVRVSKYITDPNDWFILEDMENILWVGPTSPILHPEHLELMGVDAVDDNSHRPEDVT